MEKSPSNCNSNTTHNERILRRHEVEARTGLPRSSLYRLIAAGEFPRQRRLSESTVGWLESEISTWISSREAL
ncbi:helix-turn-helix transcriptional regulator [Pseudomonas fluvialis]|uniref:helix-turn-helix transcriptional regulator n=1 Tax=Pseudomonas fluvialis TaxID=1793966 RepID=UPI0035AFB9BF